MGQQHIVNESEFYMWRAVFAFALVDNVLSLEEQELLKSYQSQAHFSQKQLEILRGDFKRPQNVVAMYNRITDPEHRTRFCVLARALVWCEGDMDRQEEAILKQVSCLNNTDESDALSESRNHPHLKTYYQEYAKAGMAGLYKNPHTMEMRV